MNSRYLFTDAEMGGIGLEKSLLSAFFLITDDKFNPIDSLELLTKPNDGVYNVTGEALRINKIDLPLHDLSAVTYNKAGTMLYNFLIKNSPKDKLIPVGHCIKGDILHYTDKLISEGSWEKFVSHNCLDTCVIAKYLQVVGKLPEMSISLSNLKDYFKVVLPGESHNAKYDVEVSVVVLNEMMKLSK